MRTSLVTIVVVLAGLGGVAEAGGRGGRGGHGGHGGGHSSGRSGSHGRSRSSSSSSVYRAPGHAHRYPTGSGPQVPAAVEIGVPFRSAWVGAINRRSSITDDVDRIPYRLTSPESQVQMAGLALRATVGETLYFGGELELGFPMNDTKAVAIADDGTSIDAERGIEVGLGIPVGLRAQITKRFTLGVELVPRVRLSTVTATTTLGGERFTDVNALPSLGIDARVRADVAVAKRTWIGGSVGRDLMGPGVVMGVSVTFR